MGNHEIASTMNYPDSLKIDFLERSRRSESIHNRLVLKNTMADDSLMLYLCCNL